MSTSSRTPSLTPSRSPSPQPPVQPDHFYGSKGVQLPPSPQSDGKTWLDPADDPLAHLGIPVFKPSMDEFQDFEAYMSRVECWGNRSGIVKIIPPKEWTDSLPPVKEQLSKVKIKSPIEQNMLGRAGLFRQENIEKRRILSIREWAELCDKDEFRAPGVDDVGLHRNANVKPRMRRSRRKAGVVKTESAEPECDAADVIMKEEPVDHEMAHSDDERDSVVEHLVASPPNSVTAIPTTTTVPDVARDAEPVDTNPVEAEHVTEIDRAETEDASTDVKPAMKTKRIGQSREVREAHLADRAARDAAFLETFDPNSAWLPPNTKATDYTFEFCQKLERQYWRNCGLGKPAWYGADTQGSLYTDDTTSWNVAHLESTLSRILPASNHGLPGVNTPYLYFGMWRATFAWHVEDMDLFSINYIHFGAPKYWYAVPQGRAMALEQTMRGYFPKDTSSCPQFLRHKSFLASPTLLAQSSCRPNMLVQHAGEFVITFPRGYHAGFNLGLNCAESVNFALDSWLDLGRRAKACECISDSVRIDVDQLLLDRELERANPSPPKPAAAPNRKRSVKTEGDDAKPRVPRKRKAEEVDGSIPKLKKIKIKPANSAASTSGGQHPTLPKLTVKLKLGPKPAEPEGFPCCLCVSPSKERLLRVHDPPIGRKDADAAGNSKTWMAHEDCANVVPETWVDEVEEGPLKEKMVFGVDGIVKDRWNLKCSACSKTRNKTHGAPIQCTKGKCSKAFHVSCAREGAGSGIVFTVLREVEKEVVLLDPVTSNPPETPKQIDPLLPGDDNIVATHVTPVPGPSDEPADISSRVLKVIKKVEVEVLCSQHNPEIAAAKKASKQDKIRNDLIALPQMTRIKIRVSAGVFEVSLIRVIEETNSVEVLWDRGVKREFKWGSVVFGSTDGPVLQKPSELISEQEAGPSTMTVPTFPSVSAAAASGASHAPMSSGGYSMTQSVPAIASTSQYAYSSHNSGSYEYWPYQGQGQQSHYAQPPHYPYDGYYRLPPTPIMGPSSATYLHPPNQNQNQHQFRGNQLLWQQPYQPPRVDGSGNYYPPHPQTQFHMHPQSSAVFHSQPISPSPGGDPRFRGTSTLQPIAVPISMPQTGSSSSYSIQHPTNPAPMSTHFTEPSHQSDSLPLHPESRDGMRDGHTGP